MHLVCPRCQRNLEYTGERPSFCGFCAMPLQRLMEAGDAGIGEALAPKNGEGTAEYPSRTITLPGGTGNPKPSQGKEYPEFVGGYRLVRQIGEGGMGAVFEAENLVSGRRVALKLIARDSSTSAEAIERFRQEGRLASTIAHPRCVFVLAADEEAGQPFIVMELMPGSTLKDLVTTQEPLNVERAVALILDVIEGLEETHRHGVIHRDVKPANCFLQEDGRVKVGDFGLSKSLSDDGHLTRTGAFLGTPLFASPEQVRGEPLDARTDVYSVSATLYYLLTGQAPFQGADATNIIARLVSEPAPSMLRLRPKLPPALDRIVLRGLERQRERRWQTLDEMRQALLVFVPGQLSFSGLGIRFAAHVIDSVVVTTLSMAGAALLTFLEDAVPWNRGLKTVIDNVQGPFWEISYFTVLEGWRGASLGKGCLHLRVCGLEGTEHAGFARCFFRVLALCAFTTGFSIVLPLFITDDGADSASLLIATPALNMLGLALLLSTMRARNGFRGIHEYLSRTRVIQLAWRTPRKTFPTSEWQGKLTQSENLPARLGPFAIEGALRWSSKEKILLARDQALGRKVWLWVRPLSAPALTKERKDLGRQARPRWVSGGRETDFQWDAFLAPNVCSLREAVARQGKFTWTEARPIFEELAEELDASVKDVSLPAQLTLDQVWVNSHGRVLLLDFSLEQEVADNTDKADEKAALRLLAETAVLMLEGQSRKANDDAGPLRAPLPIHVQAFLPRLLNHFESYEAVSQLRDDLIATRGRPTEVSRSRRAAHLMFQSLFIILGFLFFLAPLLISPKLQFLATLQSQIDAGNAALSSMREQDARSVVAVLAETDPLLRLQAAMEWQENQDFKRVLQEKLGELQEELDTWQESSSWLDDVKEGVERGMLGTPPPVQFSFPSRRQAAWILAVNPHERPDYSVLFITATTFLCAWPALLTIWSFCTRGGFSLPLTGLAAGHMSGRLASPWHCLLRALLFWIPVVTLLAGSISLDYWFWRLGDPRIQGIAAWLPAFASISCVAGFLLIPCYAFLALRTPAQSLHDRIVGTCLVPR